MKIVHKLNKQTDLQANKLIDKFIKIIDNGNTGILVKKTTRNAAKQCAVTCVEEKINTLLSCIGSYKQFWTEDEKEALDDLTAIRIRIPTL